MNYRLYIIIYSYYKNMDKYNYKPLYLLLLVNEDHCKG